MIDFVGKNVALSIEQPEELSRVAHALSSPVRLGVIQALAGGSLSVGELADALGTPMSTTALAVSVLEEAGLVICEQLPGKRGAIKLCSRKIDSLQINLVPGESNVDSTLVLTMPIGGYSEARSIRRTCGLAGDQTFIGQMDDPAGFYLPERFGAQLIWFRSGELEYRFAHCMQPDMVIDWLELSFEACSEAPMYRDPWPSDIHVSVNGQRLGIWTCPCDCGGRRGRLTPEWWSLLMTQFGYLKTWRVDARGTTLDNKLISPVTIGDLQVSRESFLRVTIGVDEDAENPGGINLFGERFGDYDQTITVRIGYHLAGGKNQ